MWLAAENGMFLRLTSSEWMTTMPENLNMDWVDSVKVDWLHPTWNTILLYIISFFEFKSLTLFLSL